MIAAGFFFAVHCTLIYGCSEHIAGFESSSTLELKETDLEINEDLLRACNNKTKHLRIVSEDAFPRKLNNNAFSSFLNLESLSLELILGDFAADYRWSENLVSLRRISFAYCRINRLPVFGFLSGLDNLTHLNLSSNFLHFLPSDLLLHSKYITVLDLSNNIFEEVPFFSVTNNLKEVLLNNNPIKCSCQNQWLITNQSFVIIDSFRTCQVTSCKYFVTFDEPSVNKTINLTVFGIFTMDCCINSNSVNLGFGMNSPIGFIAGPSWGNVSSSSAIDFSYQVAPILTPINVKFARKNQSCASFTIDHVRGHHGGAWQCLARTSATSYASPFSIVLLPLSNIDFAYENSLIFGFCVMASALFLGIFVGSVRYLTETNCCRKSQLHKYVGRTLIGVIPVIGPEKGFSISFGNIELSDRICPTCLLQSCFFCAHCQSFHAYTDIEVKPACEKNGDLDDIESVVIPRDRSPSSVQKRHRVELSCPAESRSLLDPIISKGSDESLEGKERNPNLCTLENWPSEVRNELFSQTLGDDTLAKKETEVNCLYEFPTEFCYCCHQSPFNSNPEDDISEQSMRNVKLIVKNEKLAKEYTDALQVLKDAADANDAAVFHTRLEEFRGKLLQDVGAGVRVARNELASLRAISAKRVALIRNHSAAAAQKVKASFSHSVSQMRCGMRSVAELCGVAGPIGQSISVISVYKDDNSDIPQERCISEFFF